MILGIGIDLVDIARFAHWHTYSTQQLLHVFSADEIDYCLSIEHKSAERFAARFAAREALYKALCQGLPAHTVPFLTVCKNTQIIKKSNGALDILVHWHELGISQTPHILLSMTHTHSTAAAYVVLQQV